MTEFGIPLTWEIMLGYYHAYLHCLPKTHFVSQDCCNNKIELYINMEII